MALSDISAFFSSRKNIINLDKLQRLKITLKETKRMQAYT